MLKINIQANNRLELLPFEGKWNFDLWEQASLVVQLVMNPPALQDSPVQVLGWEDPLEKG